MEQFMMSSYTHTHPHYQIVLGFGNIGVIRPQSGLVDAQSPLVILLHLLKLPLVLAQEGQVVQLLGHIWVIGAQYL